MEHHSGGEADRYPSPYNQRQLDPRRAAAMPSGDVAVHERKTVSITQTLFTHRPRRATTHRRGLQLLGVGEIEVSPRSTLALEQPADVWLESASKTRASLHYYRYSDRLP